MPRSFSAQSRVPTDVLLRALMLACERVAETSHVYDEAATPEQWVREFIRQAKMAERMGNGGRIGLHHLSNAEELYTRDFLQDRPYMARLPARGDEKTNPS